MKSRPNIVLVCSDQHSWRYTGYAGHPLVKTPNLDRLAARGTVFANAYCGSPVCTPSRACMMTGMYASDCESYCNSTPWAGKHPTWGTLMSEAGYASYATGKFDLHDDYERGFIETDVKNGHCKTPDITSLFRNPMCYRHNERPGVDGRPRDDRHGDEKRTQTAIDFLENEADSVGKPWIHWVGWGQPHPKFVALREHYEMYPVEEKMHYGFQELRHFKRVATPVPEERVRRARAGYYGMITELDEYVGRLASELEAKGQLVDTLFIYTSDHGEMLGEHGLWYKNNLYENAAHVPLVMAGPGIPAGKVVDTPVAHVDLVATLLAWAGSETKDNLRGHSLVPLMDDEPEALPGWAFSESHSEGNVTGSFMIRKGEWKYIHFTWYEDLLFNLSEDPGEFVNRVGDPSAQDILAELRRILDSQVDTEQVTKDAFAAQDRVRGELAEGKTVEEFASLLERRLGKGQAMALAHKYLG